MIPGLALLTRQPLDTRLATVDVLAWVMGADGELRPEELAMIADLRRRLALPPLDPPRAPSWSEAWPALLAPVAPEVLALAALLATSDDDLADAERACLDLLQAALGLDPGSARALIRWAEEGHRWLRKGTGLIDASRPGGHAP